MGKKKGAVRVKQVGPKMGGMGNLNPLADLMIPPEEMINLPPKPDTNTVHFWPLHETFSMKYDNFSVLWPTYMDSTKTMKKGRRLGLEDCVEEPSVYEISEALQSLQIRHVLQPYKGYPRDVESRWDNPGRVLVDMDAYQQKFSQDSNDDEDDIPVIYDVDTDDLTNKDIMETEETPSSKTNKLTKMTLMRELTKRIPHTQARVKKLEEKERQLRMEQQKKAEANRAAAAAKVKGSSANTSSNKKKGKKKR